MPCRHELCVFIKDSKSITSLNIHKRWKVEYFDTAQLDEISDSESERGEEDLEDLEMIKTWMIMKNMKKTQEEMM